MERHRQAPVVLGIGITLAFIENIIKNVSLKKSQNTPLNSILLLRDKPKECNQVFGRNSSKCMLNNFWILFTWYHIEKNLLNITKTHGLEALKLSYKLQHYYNTDLY